MMIRLRAGGCISAGLILLLLAYAWPGMADDWPQLQHDAARSGYSPDSVGAPATGDCVVKWRWHPDLVTSIAGRVQPVVHNGLLAVGFYDGRLYALDAASGDLLWSYQTGGPILHTAALDETHAYVASHDGFVYALNRSDGTLAWRHDTGAPIQNAICLANGRIYIGNSGGDFLAITTAGTRAWVYHSGRPILTSAAYSSGVVYCGNEGLYAFALNASDGTETWRVRLKGQSMYAYWPVVMESKSVVFYRTQPVRVFHHLLGAGDDLLGGSNQWNQGDGTPEETAAEHADIRAHFAGNPDHQTLWALDIQDGAEKYVAPILYTAGEGSTPTPPIFDSAAGRAWVIGRSRFARYDTPSHVRAYGGEPLKMNPDTGDYALFATATAAGQGMTAVGDESAILSADAYGVLIAHRGTLTYLRHSPEGARHVLSSQYPLIPSRDDYTHPTSPLAYDNASAYPEWSVSAGGGPGGGQVAAAAVADNAIFWIARYGLLVRVEDQ
ncbi:MAG: PQQ-binding-like beta-propeller repeat protein [Vicinamibacteria bacterium]|nr:PQQ-binding-like beta-propeller repeat protein [Vicinamibacteria bacterium]